MAASGVGQFSINVKSNLAAFYGELTKSQKTLKELTSKKHQLEIDSKQLDALRDKSQRITAEMRELRQKKTEIKLGMTDVEDAEKEIDSINKKIASLNGQKLKIDADIQPIRTANVELYKVDKAIDDIKSSKVEIDFGSMADGLDGITNKVIGVTKALVGMGTAGAAGIAAFMKEAVNAASDLEQNTGGIEKLYGGAASIVMGNSDQSYKTAGVSQNEYLEQAASFSASLIKELNGDQAKAAEAVDQALKDMSDNANVFGTDMYMIQNAYEGFAKQNYTMLDNLKLGYGGNQTGAMKLVNDFGNLDHTVTDIAEVTMPVLIQAIHNAQEAMNITGTTAKEAAETYEGSFKQMKAAWQDFLTTGNADKFAESFPVYLENLQKSLAKLSPEIIKNVKKMAKELPEKIKPILEEMGKVLSESFDAIFGEGFSDNFMKGMKPFFSAIESIFNMAEKAFGGNGKDLSWLGSAIPTLLKTIVGLKTVSAALKGLSFLGKMNIPKFSLFGGKGGLTELKTVGVEDLKSLGLKMLTIAGIAGNIYLAAKALQEVNKVGDLGELQPKMIAIAEAVVGMGLITVAVDKISKLAGSSMLTGVLTIAAIAGEIYLMTLSLEKLSKVNIDFIDIQKKMGSIALVIGEMALLTGAIGAIMATGIGALALGAGVVAIGALALEIMLLAETIKQLDEKVPNDFGNVNKKIANIISVLETIVDSELSSLGALFDSIVTGFTTGSIIKTLDNMIVISEKLKELNTKGSTINSEKTNKIISSIQSILNELSLDGGFWSSVGQAFKNKADSAVYFNAIDSLDNIIDLAGRIKKIEKLSINSDKVQKNIEAIQKILPLIDVKNFSEIGFSPVKPKFVDSIDTTIYYIIKLFDRIKELESMSMDITKAQTNLVNVKGLARMLTIDKWEEFNDGLVNENLLKNLEEAIKLLSNVNEQMNKFIDSVPEIGKAQDALVNIRGSLRMLKAENWDEFNEGYVTSNLFAEVIETLKSLEKISKSMATIATNSVETGVVQDIVVNIKGALRMLKSSDWEEFSEGFVDKNLIEPSLGALKIIQELSEKLLELSKIPLEIGSAQDVIVNLKGALRMLKAENWIEFQSGFVDKKFIEPLTSSLDVINEIAEKLKKLALLELDSGKANDNLAALRGVLRMLVIDKWTEYESGFVDKNLIEPVTLVLDTLKVLGEKLQDIGTLNVDGNSKKINDEIAAIKGCLRMMRADSWIDFQNGFIESKTLDKAVEALKVLRTITDKFAELQPLNADEVNKNIARVKGLLRSLKAEKWDEYVDSMVSKEDLQKYGDLIEPLKTAISKMSEIKSDEIDIAGIQKNITAFMGLMNRITLDNFPDSENLISTEMVDKASSTIDSLVNFGNKLPTLGNIEFSEGAVISRLSSMKRIIDTMNEFSYEEGMQNAASLIQVFIDMANKMVEMSSTTFQPIGKSWGEKVVQGFQGSDVPKQIMTIIDTLVAKLNKKVNAFKNIGSSWGNALKNSFNSSVQGIGSGIDNQINSLQSKAEVFSRLGNMYGKYLNDGFNNALVLLDNSISSRVSKLQQLTNNSQSGNNSSNTNSTRPRPVVLASGGKTFSPSGYSRIIDSPEQPILQNGEGVIPKRIMDKIGMPFFEQLRRGQISPTFANLGRSISNTTSSVINNIYNNTTTNQQMSVYTTASPDVVQLSNRRLR